MDFYKILGVSRDASQMDIKLAYRKLAKTCHPDKGGDTIEFQKIQEAYETLSDTEKKRNYDNPQQHNIFTTQPPTMQRKGDVQYSLKVSLKDVYFGAVRKVRVQRTKLCPLCNVRCGACGGEGTITQHLHMGIFTQVLQSVCNMCSGTGRKVNSNRCNACNSTGNIVESNVFQVEIEKGMASGARTVFKEWGEQPTKPNQLPGDLCITVQVEESGDFTRRDLDLYFRQPIDLRHTMIGRIITIPHFEGPVNLEVSGFGIVNPNKEYIVFGKGLQNASGKKGNLHITFDINYPDKVLTDVEIKKLTAIFDEIGI
ncbi:J domain-containing protein [bacterium]|nr:J domain-containing protein [bacterium]NDC94157.1 J domain-containing protein [bacterium]NDD82755.1 J domain-containing protein [bacterium]NDG29406.1 J domain-containing protein [bacterium]